MMLLFDLGNSRCKWQLRDGASTPPVTGGAHPYTDDGRLPSPLFDALAALHERPAEARVCTVAAPELLQPLDDWLRAHFGCALQRFVTRAKDAGVTNAYPQPSTLGADRWAALIGARVHYEGRLCIVDCGTAVTLDVLEADGRHAGGLIFPGLRLSRRTLATAAHRLGDAGEGELPLLASDTPTAIRAGTYHALAGALEGLKARVDAQDAGRCHGVLTGGDADVLAATLGSAWTVDHDLIFRGVASGTVDP